MKKSVSGCGISEEPVTVAVRIKQSILKMWEKIHTSWLDFFLWVSVLFAVGGQLHKRKYLLRLFTSVNENKQ